MPENWLRFDERLDVLTSLSFCSKCLDDVAENPAAWKWAILSMHNALQGSMVCHLSGTGGFGALSEQSFKKLMAWHDRDRRGEIRREYVGPDMLGIPSSRIKEQKDYPPRARLADASELFKRLYDVGKRHEGGAGAILTIPDPIRVSFRCLHSYRNDFSHFPPQLWSIDISRLPQDFIHIIKVMKQIADDPWPFRHCTEEESTRLCELLKSLHIKLKTMTDNETSPS